MVAIVDDNREPRSCGYSTEKRILVTLWYLGTPESYRCVGQLTCRYPDFKPFLNLRFPQYVCVCVRVCVLACVRARVRACVLACVRARACARACVCMICHTLFVVVGSTPTGVGASRYCQTHPVEHQRECTPECQLLSDTGIRTVIILRVC